MSLSNKDHEDHLKALETLLEGSPDGQEPALSNLLKKLESFIEQGDVQQAEATIQLLGTAVGAETGWQTPFRESGVLSFTLQQLVEPNSLISLKKQYLRVIGNSVADNDTNREIVTKDLPKLSACILSKDLTTIALIVLFNLCNDYDPAKAASAVMRLDAIITSQIAANNIPEAALDYAVDLLSWTTEKITTEQLKDDISFGIFENLLKVALQYDEDHHEEYVAILVHYLQDLDFQSMAATPSLLDDLVSLMLDFEERITPEESEAVFRELSMGKNDERSPSDEHSVILLSQLISSISAISATDAFAKRFDVTSQPVEKLRTKLRAPSDSPSTVCACVMLGNLAMSDQACTDMVNIMEIHASLISILNTSDHPALLYAAAGYMRHLTFPEANRHILVDSGLLQTCCRLLKLEDPSVRGEAAAMLAKLVTNNFRNIEKVVHDKASKPNTTANESSLADITVLEHIVGQALAPAGPLPSTAMKNPMIELGRTIVAMLRYLGRPNTEKDVDAVREDMFKVPLLARPVARLIRQRFYADARSEGLLGLGLMAQVSEGANQILVEIKEDSGLLDAIKDFANGTDGGVEQQGAAAGRDYQNAMVMLQALQNHTGNAMDEGLRSQVVDIQEELGRLMV